MACESLSSLLLKQMGTTQPLYADTDAVRWLLQIATDLQALHSEHPAIIYRHLEPSSVLLSSTQYNNAAASLVKTGERQRSESRPRLSDGVGLSFRSDALMGRSKWPKGSKDSRKFFAEECSSQSRGPREALVFSCIVPQGAQFFQGDTNQQPEILVEVAALVAPGNGLRDTPVHVTPLHRLLTSHRGGNASGAEVKLRPSLSEALSSPSRLMRVSPFRALRRSLSNIAERSSSRLRERGPGVEERAHSFSLGPQPRSSAPGLMSAFERTSSATRRRSADFLSRTLSGDGGVESRRASMDVRTISGGSSVSTEAGDEDTALSLLEAINEQCSLRAPVPRSVFADLKADFWPPKPQGSEGGAGDSGTARTGQKGGLASRSSLELPASEGQRFLSTTLEPVSAMYMPPEVYRKERHDVQADIFSFGLLMYEVFARQLRVVQVSGAGDNPDKRKAHARDMAYGFRPPMDAGVPKAMADLIRQCWEDDPDERPTASQLLTALESIKLRSGP